ncbi:hypothetical protein AB0M92_37115 [Streptomyces sp. NPDC051582]|uniref:hypothetical protein n=1 Tax=Streptomyces sp. NPDC051582 TaxID=3155167 RepID=UPI0034141467
MPLKAVALELAACQLPPDASHVLDGLGQIDVVLGGAWVELPNEDGIPTLPCIASGNPNRRYGKPFQQLDRRLIQTAVFGSSDSDEPALCPETVEELDAFRREHESTTIWCGTKFEGGCGRRLTTRRCTDKICHFAHYGADGAGQRCGRTAKGKDSADHLFAKAHLAAWLRAHGLTAEFTYPEPLGSAVRAQLDDGRTFLLHLDRSRPVAWDDDAGRSSWDPACLLSRTF